MAVEKCMKQELIKDTDREILKDYGLKLSSLSGIHRVSYEPRELVLQQEDQMDCLYIILHGTAKICINAQNGKNLILTYYISKGLLGSIEIMKDSPTGATTVTALTPLHMIAIPFASNTASMRENIVFMNYIAKSLADIVVNSDNARVASALYSSEERLCSYILMSQRRGLFTDVLSDAAQSVGMSYRHIFRIMNKLCADGILKKTDQGYKIIDKEALQKKSSQ